MNSYFTWRITITVFILMLKLFHTCPMEAFCDDSYISLAFFHYSLSIYLISDQKDVLQSSYIFPVISQSQSFLQRLWFF